MAILTVALEDGYADEPVEVRIDGRRAFRKEHVRTRTQISLAESFESTVPEGPILLEIDLPARNLSRSITVEVSERLFVGISVSGGDVQYRQSEETTGHA